SPNYQTLGPVPLPTLLALTEPPDAADNRIYAEVRVGNRKYRALVDTGSAKSYIDERTAEEWKTEGYQPTSPPHSSAQLANGHTCVIQEAFTMPCIIQNTWCTSTFMRLPGLFTGMLLGMDMLQACGLLINTRTRTLEGSSTSVGTLASFSATKNIPQTIQDTLQTELQKFSQLQGPTHLVTHHIRL
ncbi:hypothetical protein CBL_20270, partial [Carabus blaptoides fortunei]